MLRGRDMEDEIFKQQPTGYGTIFRQSFQKSSYSKLRVYKI